MKPFFPFLLVLASLFMGCTAEQSRVSQEQREPSQKPDPAHNAKNALDWAGTYAGSLPCQDCEAITVNLTLRTDQTFEINHAYVGSNHARDTTYTGTFTWNEDGSTVRLSGVANQTIPTRFFVEEGRIVQLAESGERITGKAADKLALTLTTNAVEATNPLANKWMLTELMGKPVESSSRAAKIYLVFEEDSPRFHGFTGCNRISGQYEKLASTHQIRFSQIASTKMACKDMVEENELLRILTQVDNFAINDGVLSLQRARMAPLARFKVANTEED